MTDLHTPLACATMRRHICTTLRPPAITTGSSAWLRWELPVPIWPGESETSFMPYGKCSCKPLNRQEHCMMPTFTCYAFGERAHNLHQSVLSAIKSDACENCCKAGARGPAQAARDCHAKPPTSALSFHAQSLGSFVSLLSAPDRHFQLGGIEFSASASCTHPIACSCSIWPKGVFE